MQLITPDNIQFYLKGAGLSLVIAISALVMGLLIATLTASIRISRNKPLKLLATMYVEIIRGTPMLLQLLIFYLGIPYLYQQITGQYLPVSPLVMGIIAVSINSGAYTSETIRASINSIDKGQWEAGLSLGLKRNQVLSKIILPQAFKRILPPLVNEFIILIKDSSLVSTLGVVELMKSATIISARTYDLFTPLIGAACVYLVLTLTTSYIANKLERKLQASD